MNQPARTSSHYEVLQANNTELDTHIGLLKGQSSRIAHELSKVLADSTVLMMKTLNVHWNTVGPLFYSIHKLTEEQYQEIFESLDAVAERVRMLGEPSPGSLKAFLELSGLKEFESDNMSVEDTISELVNDHEYMIISLRKLAEKAEKVADATSSDLITDRLSAHEKYAWMLKSILTQ